MTLAFQLVVFALISTSLILLISIPIVFDLTNYQRKKNKQIL